MFLIVIKRRHKTDNTEFLVWTTKWTRRGLSQKNYLAEGKQVRPNLQCWILNYDYNQNECDWLIKFIGDKITASTTITAKLKKIVIAFILIIKEREELRISNVSSEAATEHRHIVITLFLRYDIFSTTITAIKKMITVFHYNLKKTSSCWYWNLYDYKVQGKDCRRKKLSCGIFLITVREEYGWRQGNEYDWRRWFFLIKAVSVITVMRQKPIY